MIHFRLRDFVSVVLYRLVRFAFARFGNRVRIVWPLRLVGTRFMSFGNEVTLQFGAYVAAIRDTQAIPRLTIGDGTLIGNFSHIICTRRIEIGARVLIADRVYISDNSHDYSDVTRPVRDQPVVQLNDVSIGDGAWIGENVCIVGCKIGKNCVIGANSVVTRDIPDFCVARGSPAVTVKRYCPDTRTWRKTDATGGFVP